MGLPQQLHPWRIRRAYCRPPFSRNRIQSFNRHTTGARDIPRPTLRLPQARLLTHGRDRCPEGHEGEHAPAYENLARGHQQGGADDGGRRDPQVEEARTVQGEGHFHQR